MFHSPVIAVTSKGWPKKLLWEYCEGFMQGTILLVFSFITQTQEGGGKVCLPICIYIQSVQKTLHDNF